MWKALYNHMRPSNALSQQFYANYTNFVSNLLFQYIELLTTHGTKHNWARLCFRHDRERKKNPLWFQQEGLSLKHTHTKTGAERRWWGKKLVLKFTKYSVTCIIHVNDMKQCAVVRSSKILLLTILLFFLF